MRKFIVISLLSVILLSLSSGLSDEDISVEINSVEENFPSDEFTGLSELEFSLDVEADVERNGFRNYIYYSEVTLIPEGGGHTTVYGDFYDFESYQPTESSSNPVLNLEYPQIDGFAGAYRSTRTDLEPGESYDLELTLFIQHETEEGGIVDADEYQLDTSLTYTGENYMYPDDDKEYTSLDGDVNGNRCNENFIYSTETYEGNNYICDCEDGACSWITTKNEQGGSETDGDENEEESETMCSGDSFDAWLTETEVLDYPIEINGCATEDLEQINVMLRNDDGVNSYSTLSITTSGVNCEEGDCGFANVEYTEHEDRDYDFTITIDSGKDPSGLYKPVEVDTDLIALNERYTGGRAGYTDSEWLEEACNGDTYSCLDVDQPYKADLVTLVGLETDYTPGENIVLENGQTVRFPEGCDYQATYVYQNAPKIKIWESGTYNYEESLSDTDRLETDQGTNIEVDTKSSDEITFSATCSEWDNSDGQNSGEVETDSTWINYCQDQDHGDLTQSDNIVSCLSSCYGEDKESSAEGSDLTCGEVVKSFCESADADYMEDGDTARCSG